ncbi:glycerophosphodiester phosphodiesterase family protein [Pontixanthobacter aquaemixtae]|uniref:Glycerophosphodiester phosphodiesterase n=1 Tax=Pontixanthobacter aquaemixtae TaxID=1958940 RepID=A0A844ZWI7_9SPHN|nr:glycerophosphodiester phosphodiesterase family protein [Pontixanthobacter aquaemixtae]MXO91316.1 glycerophosphodiester phosphodiesterase [Pontixanthobacter aquaemixtae]
MKIWLTRIGTFAAIAFLVLTVMNASWLADTPGGSVKLIAHRGISQHFDRAGVEQDTCTATRIEQPVHEFVENTRFGVVRAARLGAEMVEIDIAPTADGELVAFHDWTLDCRTDGTGPVREATLAELQALDAGYGYTADDGKTFPLRGTPNSRIQSIKEIVRYLPAGKRVMFNFKSAAAAEADMLAAVLKDLGRDPVAEGDSFYGDAPPVARIRELYPDAWAWSPEAAKQCTSDYIAYGWTSIVPASCENGTLIIPINRQFLFWGWPNRLTSRMAEVNARVIVTGPHVSNELNTGLTLPEQLGDIPRSFNGYVWVDDIWTIGPALYPDRDLRSADDIAKANAGLERRRERQ